MKRKSDQWEVSIVFDDPKPIDRSFDLMERKDFHKVVSIDRHSGDVLVPLKGFLTGERGGTSFEVRNATLRIARVQEVKHEPKG